MRARIKNWSDGNGLRFGIPSKGSGYKTLVAWKDEKLCGMIGKRFQHRVILHNELNGRITGLVRVHRIAAGVVLRTVSKRGCGRWFSRSEN